MSNHFRTGRRAVLLAGVTGLGVLGTHGIAAAQAKGGSKLKKIREAVTAMQAARADLVGGAGFGGHKKLAIDALDSAILELEAAIAYVEGKK